MLVTTREVAALLRVHPKHVYRLLKRGLPADRVGDAWRFDDGEVLAWARASGTLRKAPPVVASRDREPLLAANGDIAIEALFDELKARRAPLVGRVQADHAEGMALLDRRAVLLAGCHGDRAPQLAAQGRLAHVRLATRELGLAFRRGRRVTRASIVVGKRLASRPTTAGIRARFDAVLAHDGVDSGAAHAGATLYASHRDATAAVVRGDAEFALASRAWAAFVGLGFFSFATEGYGLALAADDLGDPRVVAICEAAQRGAFRRRLAETPGYDARATGRLTSSIAR
jgi:excisionase family DNA binding protein